MKKQKIPLLAALAGILGTAGWFEMLVHQAPWNSPVHWVALLILFGLYPALVIVYTARDRDGPQPLAAAALLSLAHLIGAQVAHLSMHGTLWDDLLVIPMLEIPVGIAAATLTRWHTRRALPGAGRSALTG